MPPDQPPTAPRVVSNTVTAVVTVAAVEQQLAELAKADEAAPLAITAAANRPLPS
jgi:hypothetical protein